MYERSLKLKEALGPDSPAIVDICYNLAQLCMEGGDMRGALAYITRVHTIAQQYFGDDHPLAQESKQKRDALKKMVK